jgi:predicted HNH restriction endonuclease
MICIANKFLAGEEYHPDNFNAVEAKDFFMRRGYRILDRKTGTKKSKIVTEDEESNFPEGKEKFKEHRYLERDSSISKKAKELRLDQVGELRCDACHFSFSDTYGEHGAGFIEAHHTTPVNELCGNRKTRIEEIALVCSNCHRMLHSGSSLLSIEELQAIIENRA